MVGAEAVMFLVLGGILHNARWAGAPSQEELRKEYYRERMWDGVRKLPEDEGSLARILSEIMEDLESANEEAQLSAQSAA
jgi:hypothetical protein